MPSIWVISPDRTTRALIIGELDSAGYGTRGFESMAEAFAELARPEVAEVIIMDDQGLGLDSVKLDAIKHLAPHGKVVLLAGALTPRYKADEVLHRPFSIGDLRSRIAKLVEAGNGD